MVGWRDPPRASETAQTYQALESAVPNTALLYILFLQNDSRRAFETIHPRQAPENIATLMTAPTWDRSCSTWFDADDCIDFQRLCTAKWSRHDARPFGFRHRVGPLRQLSCAFSPYKIERFTKGHMRPKASPESVASWWWRGEATDRRCRVDTSGGIDFEWWCAVNGCTHFVFDWGISSTTNAALLCILFLQNDSPRACETTHLAKHSKASPARDGADMQRSCSINADELLFAVLIIL